MAIFKPLLDTNLNSGFQDWAVLEQDALTIEAKSDDDNQISRLNSTDPLFFERDVQFEKQGESYADITNWALRLQQYPCCIRNRSRYLEQSY